MEKWEKAAFYSFLNKHFKLGLPTPVVERDYVPLSREQLTVWNDQHPAPKAADPDFERRLLKWFSDDAEKQLRSGDMKVVQGAVEVLIGRTFANAGEAEWKPKDRQDRGDFFEVSGTLTNKTYNEEINAALLQPKIWNGRTVIWLDDNGKAALQNDAVKKLLQTGTAVLTADLFLQGGEPIKQTVVVKNPREFAGYTHGYNHSLFARRTHDVLTIVKFLRTSGPVTDVKTKSIALSGWGQTGPIALAARALAGAAVDRAAADTGGFRFGQLLDYRDPMFLPGGAKYLDVPGLIALNAPHAFWLSGEGPKPELFGVNFGELTAFSGEAKEKQNAAAEWLLR